MFKTIFAKLFSTPQQPPAASAAPKSSKDSAKALPDIVEYYKAEIANSPFIKESGRDAVLKDFLHEAKLKDGEPLSLEEKRSRGINSRLKITRELYEVLTPRGVEFGPKKALKQLYIKATFNHNLHSHIARMKSAGITQYTPMSCGDGRDCEWCVSMSGKHISINVDFAQLVKENCTCDHCGCVLIAKFDF